MEKLVISRKVWLRGLGGASCGSCLLNEQGKMCCLGILGKQRKVPKSQMLFVDAPHDIDDAKIRNKFPKELLAICGNYVDGSVIEFQLMKINDDEKISDKMREYKLKRKFTTIGIEAVFVD